MENKAKHLEFIQKIISRLSGNLFLLKGWSVTLIVGLLAVMAQQMKPVYFLFAFCVLFIFWILDGYFLSMERCFRAVYDEVRLKKEKEIDFSMKYKHHYSGRNTWIRSMFSKTLNIFYGILLLVMIVAVIASVADIKVNFDVKWRDNNPINLTK